MTEKILWQGEIDDILEILGIKDITPEQEKALDKWIDAFRESVLDEHEPEPPGWAV